MKKTDLKSGLSFHQNTVPLIVENLHFSSQDYWITQIKEIRLLLATCNLIKNLIKIGEKLVGGLFAPPILNRVKPFYLKMVQILKLKLVT